MKIDLVGNLSDGIARTEAGSVTSPSGSWLAGMFGKAADFSRRSCVSHIAGQLSACDLTYPGISTKWLRATRHMN